MEVSEMSLSELLDRAASRKRARIRRLEETAAAFEAFYAKKAEAKAAWEFKVFENFDIETGEKQVSRRSAAMKVVALERSADRLWDKAFDLMCQLPDEDHVEGEYGNEATECRHQAANIENELRDGRSV